MKKYSEDDLQQALQAFANGQSLRKASLKWGVPRRTLQDRLTGTQPRRLAFAPLQRLSQTQEDHLAKWVLIQASLGLPPTHSQLKEFAERVLQVKGDLQPLGKKWVQAFIRRNPSIKVQRAKSIDSKRVNGATTDIIRPWFRLLNIPAIKDIKPANRYNMDESGLLEGWGSNGLVLGGYSKTAIRKKQPSSRA
jgi:hypothetical protein